MMVTLVVLATVLIVLGSVMYAAGKSKTMTTNGAESSQAARAAIDMIGRDLRTAGYGADLDYTVNPQPGIAYIDSMQVLLSENISPYPDTVAAIRGIPQAYNPAGAGNPFPLAGTPWQPPIKYRTGAELVRWTLDVNNDGVVDANDIASADGADAARTPNPGDYELVRQVYGDSTNGVADSNGPQTDRITLISRPGGAVAPLFTVYLGSSSTPWNWASGPVPPSLLRSISRVVVQVAAPSGKADSKGRYSQTIYRTDINSLRNTPNFGDPTFAVDGYIYNDLNKNHLKDTGEPGVSKAFVTLDDFSTTTSTSGYFLFQAPAGTYTLRHTPPEGYGNFQVPDSFVVTVAPATSRSFADTLKLGGFVTASVYEDANESAARDPGEWGLGGVKLTMSPGGEEAWTDTSGVATLFATVGVYSVSCAPPDSFTVTTPNPTGGSMTNGGSASISFGLVRAPRGTIQGTVFQDNNKNGVIDGGEPGLNNVYVAVMRDIDQNVMGFIYTDVNGAYSMDVPLNDPDHTMSYSIFFIPPTGYFPTTPTSLANIWVQGGSLQTNKNFGASAFTIISVTANRVLSLASNDMFEQDWVGTNQATGQRDVDIALGADAAGTDQISVWFNRYTATPLFTGTPSYTRSAPGAVLAMAVDSLDSKSQTRRPDLVTGTPWSANGNFFVWINQNSSGNEGYIPTTYDNYSTSDKGDVTAVLLADVAGTDAVDYPDIIVGTKSPTANHGTIEVWMNTDNKGSPTFTPVDVYPNDGGVPGNSIGEVTSMVRADLNGDGYKDLIVGTRTGSYRGQVIVLEGSTGKKSKTPHFKGGTSGDTLTFSNDVVTSVAAVDVDGDGRIDIVAGTQSGTASGSLYYFRNTATSGFDFTLTKQVDVGAIVTGITVADLGGSPRGDLAVGRRESASTYGGGVKIYYLDLGNIPDNGTDPSSGSEAITNMVPALTSGNYNYGTNPLPSAPYRTDLAVGVKSSATTGKLVVFIR
jgi:hypothetical protein